MKTIYYGGTILSMEQEQPIPALLVDGETIEAWGTREELETLAPGARKADLEGRTLLPAFVDGHSHITALAQTMGLAQLQGCRSLEEIGERLKAFQERWNIPPGEWVMGFGYDQNDLEERRHPAAADLDRFLPGHPAMATHASGHMGAVNTLGMRRLGLTRETPDPDGGRMGRREDGSLSGYLEEAAFTGMGARIPRDPHEQLKNLARAQQVYFSHGIATMQEGLTREGEWNLLETAASQGILQGDVAAYVDIQKSPQLWEKHGEYRGTYRNHLKIAGYKLFLDGSPQGRTAWLKEPYAAGAPGNCGYPLYPDRQVTEFLRKAQREQAQIAVHCNGDAAAEQLLRCYERAFAAYGHPIRPIMIHAQLLDPDQLPRLARLGMIASFFVAHVYHWGDVHLENLGWERASRISPAKTALDQGVVFDFHQDSPVIPPNTLETLWCAVCRRTRKGILLGKDQRISPWEALKAVTCNAAYALFEERRKGSLAPGKQADLVMLDRNPLTCLPEALKDLQVLETIHRGKTVYRRKS